jgi:hypothetical protein
MKRGGANLAAAELGRLIKTIERLSDLPRRVAIEAAPKLTDELRRQFDRGVDPYGRPWAPLKPATLAKGRHAPPLTDSGELRDGTRAMVAPGGRAGIRLVLGAPYGFFHQVGYRNGRTKVPPRRILPQYGIPRAWALILRQAARVAARKAVA